MSNRFNTPGDMPFESESSFGRTVGSPKEVNEAEESQKFAAALNNVLPLKFATEYAASFVKQAISAECPQELTAADLAELGVRIGHRKAVDAVLADMRQASVASPTAAADEEDDASTYASIEGAHPHKPPNLPTEDYFAPVELDGGMRGGLEHTKLSYSDGDCWHDFAGVGRTVEAFNAEFKAELHKQKLPPGFLRMFSANKPMPYALQLPARGSMVTGMLLRVPLADMVTPGADGSGPVPDSPAAAKFTRISTNATTLHNLANRLVLIYRPGTARARGTLLTYRKDANLPWVVELRSRWRNGDGSSDASLEAVAVRLLRDSHEAFRDVLATLRQELEVCTAVPDSYRAREVVKTLSRIRMQAAVMRRCLAGNERVLKTVAADAVFGPDLSRVIAQVEDLKEVADELSSNAGELLDLRLAMIDFKAQMNMKVFTYITAVVSPLGLVTGWFGMNFEDMKELRIPGFYYGVVAVCATFMLAMVLWLWWFSRDRVSKSADIEEATFVLERAEGDDDE